MKDKWFALGISGTLFLSSIGFGFFDKPKEMGLAIIAGVVTMAFANIDKILRSE